MLKKTLELIFVLIFISLVAPPITHAYLDPGSGSYLIQIIIASIAGGGYLLRANWNRIKAKFFKKDKKDKENGNRGKLF